MSVGTCILSRTRTLTNTHNHTHSLFLLFISLWTHTFPSIYSHAHTHQSVLHFFFWNNRDDRNAIERLLQEIVCPPVSWKVSFATAFCVHIILIFLFVLFSHFLGTSVELQCRLFSSTNNNHIFFKKKIQ